MRHVCVALVLVAGLQALPAAADDPKDPAMRSAAARARDHERIRQLNLAQLAYVRQRDEGYAAGWAAHRSDGENVSRMRDFEARNRDHQRAMADYASAEAEYERRMAAWREQVSSCRTGDGSACR